MLENPQARHPHVDLNEFARMRAMGEIEITAHPGRFASLTLKRFWLFWIPERSHVLLSIAQWALAALAAAGLVLLRRENHRLSLLVAGIWATCPLLYYLVQADLRYRYPIGWSVVLAAGLAAHGILRQIGDWYGSPLLAEAGPEFHRDPIECQA